MILGIDISTHLEELEANAKYYENGKEVDPIKIFTKQGVSYFRIRVWNNPFKDDKPYLGGTNDLNSFIKLAKIAKENNCKVVLDLHYSDFWADPGKQMTPKAWRGLSFEEILVKVNEFTKEALLLAKENGIEVDYIQVGNEITNGMIWPYGKLDESISPRGNYENLTRILKEGIKASKEINKDIKTIIHLERSYDQNVYREYFDKLKEYEVDYDIIGMSYSPYWHSTFDEFFANVNMCQNRFNKDVMVMELGYGFTLKDYIFNNNGETHLVVNKDSDLIKNLPYPISKEGQALFVKRFLELAKENNIKGVFYWEPIWIPGNNICWASIEGQEYINEVGKSTRNEWANQCLFDYEGNANPALYEFRVND